MRILTHIYAHTSYANTVELLSHSSYYILFYLHLPILYSLNGLLYSLTIDRNCSPYLREWAFSLHICTYRILIYCPALSLYILYLLLSVFLFHYSLTDYFNTWTFLLPLLYFFSLNRFIFHTIQCLEQQTNCIIRSVSISIVMMCETSQTNLQCMINWLTLKYHKGV